MPRHNNTRQDNIGQDKTWQDKTVQYNTRHNKTIQDGCLLVHNLQRWKASGSDA